MSTQAVSTRPTVFDDFLKPWNEWFDDNRWNKMLTVPAVNITESPDHYKVVLAAPGMKKEDFKIAVEGNMLTISSEKEQSNEENLKTYTRKEYNYSSFSRSFTLPDEVNKEKIGASYTDGLLSIVLPRKESSVKTTATNIAVK
jgi:HSP20 family protein